MRGLFWLIAVFAAAVAVALAGRLGEGYVLFVYPPWRVEVAMLLFVLAALAAFGIGYVTLRLVSHTLALPAQVRAYREGRRRTQAQGALAVALQCYFEGRYARADRRNS